MRPARHLPFAMKRPVACLACVGLSLLIAPLSPAHDHHPVDRRAFGGIMPCISDDGRSVVFSYHGAIWRTQQPSFDTLERLTKTGPGFDINPAWSRDGQRIAFVRSMNFQDGRLSQIDAETGDALPLPADVAASGKLYFDREDRRILGVFQQQGQPFRLAWYDLTTGELEEAVASGDSTGLPTEALSNRRLVFALSHDANSVALVTTADVPGEQTGNQGPQNTLWRVSVADKRPEKIAVWPARLHELCWQAEDQALVVSTERGGAHNDLWEIPPDEPLVGAQKLTHGQADEGAPSTSANGDWLCYTDNRFGPTMIVLHDVANASDQFLKPVQLAFGAPTGRLALRIVDGATGEETTARVAARHENQKFHAPERSLYRLSGDELHFYVEGHESFELPVGKYTLTAARGPEYEVARQEIEIRANEITRLTIPLERWTHQRAEGWISGESHIHANYGYGHWYNTPATMRTQCAGEDLTVANFMVANSDGDGVFDREFFLGRPDPLSSKDSILYWNEEFRATIWGHMTLLNLKWLVTPIYTGFKHTSHPHDLPMNAEIADHVHDQDGLVNYTHPAHSQQDPYGGAYTAKEMPVDVALGKVDSMDILGNHQANMAVWYRLLNCGLHLPASAGTDCFLNRINSVLPGAVRVYVHCEEEPTYDAWIENLRKGRTFATSGPMLRFTVNGEEPGAEIQQDKPGVFAVVAEAAARGPLDSLELVVNGQATKLPAEGADESRRALRVEHQLTLDQSAWVALRATARNGTFAHTSPVYVTVGNDAVESAEDAKYFIAWIQRLRDDVRRRNQIPEIRWTPVEEQLAKAIEFYQRQVDEGP